MYFVSSGHMRYLPSRRNQQNGHHDNHVRLTLCITRHNPPAEVMADIINLHHGDWLSEAVLWTNWEHCGAFAGVRESSLFVLKESEFTRVVRLNGPAHASSVLYARMFIAGLNRFGKNFHDYISADTFHTDFKNHFHTD